MTVRGKLDRQSTTTAAALWRKWEECVRITWLSIHLTFAWYCSLLTWLKINLWQKHTTSLYHISKSSFYWLTNVWETVWISLSLQFITSAEDEVLRPDTIQRRLQFVQRTSECFISSLSRYNTLPNRKSHKGRRIFAFIIIKIKSLRSFPGKHRCT